ncbi:MAG: tetratricopeptide repeat protein [Bacteroidales bacterium]|nr:tetratricopeptide repeat protein [Bacteroidales bacterium]
MANTKQNEEQLDEFENVESKFGKTELYIEENRNKLFTGVAIIALIVLGIIAYNKFIKAPNEKKAAAQMFQAENYFERDSFNLALNGDGNYPGFLKIMSDWSSTKAGNNAKYYAGICYFKTQEFDKAIECLESFSADDQSIAPISKGLLGDCYSEKGDYNKAQKLYKEAAKIGKENSFVAPIYLNKLATLLEKDSKWQDALDIYMQIKKEYPSSNEARTIDKNIQLMNIKLGK